MRSLNRTVSSVNTQANRRIAKVMGTTVGTVKSRITLLKANSSRWIASLKAGGRPFRLAHFKPRQTKQGVTAAAWGNQGNLPGDEKAMGFSDQKPNESENPPETKAIGKPPPRPFQSHSQTKPAPNHSKRALASLSLGQAVDKALITHGIS